MESLRGNELVLQLPNPKMTSIKSCHISFHTVYKCTKLNFSQPFSHSSAFIIFLPLWSNHPASGKKDNELVSLPKVPSLIGWPSVATCFQFLSFPSNSVMFICAQLNWGPSVFNQFSGFYAFSCILWPGVKSFDPIMRLLISRREAQMTGKRLPLGVRSNPFNIGVGAGRPLAFTSVIIIIVIVITNITKCSNFPICFNQG